MSKIFDYNKYSFNTKIALSVFIFILFYLLIRFSLIIPKIESSSYENSLNNIDKNLKMIKEEIKLAGESIFMQTSLEKKLSKKQIELEVLSLNLKEYSYKNLKKAIKNSTFIKECSYKIYNNDIYFEKLKVKNAFLNNNNINNTWQELDSKIVSKNFARNTRYNIYNTSLKNNNLKLSISCKNSTLNKNHHLFEKEIKKHIQKNISILKNTYKGETSLIWMNPNLKDKNTRLYIKNKKLSKKSYIISNISSVNNISTGTLSAKDVYQARDKKPLEHLLNNKKALTWVVKVHKNEKAVTLLLHTVYKKNIYEQTKSAYLKLLPETLISLGVTLFILLLIFRRLFQNINKLSKTAKLVNQGKKNIRSYVKGSDDIGILGIAFDKMLDSLEDNIKTLDKKVEEKTKALKLSLDKKDTLLREIHHRVKNNLALTISFIELQEDEIKDKALKKVLKEIQDRIYTMELLHRKLYQSTDLNSVNMKEYVQELTNSILRVHDSKSEVSVNIDIENIVLNIDTAMPCGLVLNELITNVFKYAFEDKKDNKKLSIKIFKDNDFIRILVKDNGKGLDKSFDITNSTSLGIKLIYTIVKLQLFGEISYKYEEGALFTIKAKIKDFTNIKA